MPQETTTIRHGIKNPYKSYRWIKLKKEIIKEAGEKCSRCGVSSSETQLLVHHKFYIFGNYIYDYPRECFVSACRPCHAFMHSNKGKKEGWFKP
jgi:hypothetical protein